MEPPPPPAERFLRTGRSSLLRSASSICTGIGLGSGERRREGEKERRREGEKERRRQGEKETRRQGDKERRRQGDKETRRQGDTEISLKQRQKATLLSGSSHQVVRGIS
jgi:hypothetical protein